jgi:SAM-dependent methyltransferase
MSIPKPILPIPPHWNLSEEQLYKIFTVEKEQASLLRNTANQAERKRLYGSVYETYFNQLYFHPQFTIKSDEQKKKNRVDFQWHQVKPFMNKEFVFVEVGAGDCSFTLAVAKAFKKVIALEVSDEIVSNIQFPENASCVIFDGFNIPLEENSVDVVYSNQLMEHLHPEDAEEQLRGIQKILKPGGTYTCITPNRLTGPHDISRFYTDELVGFHLKEYSATDLKNVFKNAGFSSVKAHVYLKGKYIFIPFFMITYFESFLGLFSKKSKRKVLSFKVFRILFNSFITAVK